MKDFFARSEIAVHDIIQYLKNFGSMSETMFLDDDGDGIDTDMGYLMDGLRQLESYFAFKKRGE